MASQLYESVMANDAKRDALKKKKVAKPLPHPQSKSETRFKKTADAQTEKRSKEIIEALKLQEPRPKPDLLLGRKDEGRKGGGDTTPVGKGIVSKSSMEAAKERQAAQGRNLETLRDTFTSIRDQGRKAVADWRAKNRPEAAKAEAAAPNTAQAASGPAASVAAKPPSSATTSYRLPQSGQAKPEGVKPHTGRPQSGQAKPESTTQPRKTTSYTKVRSKPKGAAGAASNRDLPGRTVITYRSRSDAPASTTDKPSNYGTTTNKPPASDRAARIAKAQAAAKAHKASDYRRGGAAARSRAMNRND